MSRAILVTGATGKQGGAVVNALLANRSDFQILALTRDTSSPSAQRLAGRSDQITLVQGNLDDCEAIFANAAKATTAPIWGVFSVQLFGWGKNGPAIEEKQGSDLIDAAIKHNVQYFVYTSVDRHGARSADNPTNVPHFASKHAIEQHLLRRVKETGVTMDWTILRPAAFMENFDGGFIGKIFSTAWKNVVKAKPLQLIATQDIGFVAAHAFMNHKTFASRSISIAGDEVTYAQMLEIFRQQTGSDVPTTFGLLVRFFLWMSAEMGNMFNFFAVEGYDCDIAETRKIHPEAMDLKTWLGKNKGMYVKKAQ